MMRAAMTRWMATVVLALALLGCGDDRDWPEDPPYAVPGMDVTQPVAGQPSPGQLAMAGAPATFDPPLAVPGQPSPIPPPPAPPMPPGMQPGQVPPGMPPGQVPAEMQPNTLQMQPAQPLTLAPGFVPDPAVARGVATGQIPATALHPDCAGFVPSQPAHVVTLSSAFPTLRVLVSSAADTVLVIRQPDGSFRCNDDTEPGVVQNPTLEGAFAPGAYTIWVGMYARETPPTPYVIGFTESAAVTHAALGT